MALLHLSTKFDQLEILAAYAADASTPLVLSLDDADSIVCLASLKDQWRCPVGVWLQVSPEYSAALLARDVKTLSWIIDLSDVVVAADSHAESHAQIVRALLSDDEVNVANDAATITSAYNRPAPPRELMTWSFDGTQLKCGDRELRLSSSERTELGTIDTYG